MKKGFPILGKSVNIVVDTNILVYLYSDQDVSKRTLAKVAIKELQVSGQGVLTTQVLGEFFSTITSTRKLKNPYKPTEASALVKDLMDNWPILPVNSEIVASALHGMAKYTMSYWDALIWATAKAHDIGTIYSEDGPTNAILEGVRYENPLNRPVLGIIRERTLTPYASSAKIDTRWKPEDRGM